MAKKTKDSGLSIEEKLEQALIPNWDEPYKLPDNWCWVKIETLAAIYTGNSINERVKSEKYYGRTDGLTYLATKDIDFDSKINYDTNVCIPLTDGFKVAPTNSTLLCIEGGSAGRKVGFITRDVCFVNKLCAFIPNDAIEPKYLYYIIKSPIFKVQFDEKKHGLIGGVSVKEISSIYVPFAPLNQQKKIVSYIQSLFAKLDEAAEKAQVVLDGYETRKAAILHQAFSGELTAKWRESFGVNLNSWQDKKINEICIARAGYAFDSKEFTNHGYQIIRMGNLYGGRLDLERNPVYINLERLTDTTIDRALIHDGDILITLTGTKYKRDYGYAVRIDNPKNLLVNQRILCLTPKMDIVVTNFILYYLQSNIFRDVFFSNETGGVNQGNVSSKFVESILINLPTIYEQKEICQVLDNILFKEQQIKEAAEQTLEKIQSMKKSILAKAFRGELGTNNPDEESAIELLKQILDTEIEPKRTNKRTLIPKDLEDRIKTETERKIIKRFVQNNTDVLLISELMGISSNKFELMEALRNLQERGLLSKEKDYYKLLR